MALRSGRASGSDDDMTVPDDDGRMTLREHLTELRSRIIKSLLAVAIGGVVGWILYDAVFNILIDPYCDVLIAVESNRECDLIATAPGDGLTIRMKLAAYVGLALALPVVMWQLWRFITPGLYEKEKRYAVPFVLASVVLFVMGAGLAFLTFPQALAFLVDIGGSNLEPFYTPTKYLSFVTFMMLAFGAGFQFPIVLVFLEIAGVIGWRQLASWRRYAIVIIFAVVAVITPSGDPFTLLALALPMVLFYEISILLGRFVFKKP